MKDAIKRVGGIILSIAPTSLQTFVKEKVELMFWRKTLRKTEGEFFNGHMERMFTTLFGLTKEYYVGRRVLDIGCGPIGTLEWCDGAVERVGVDPLSKEYQKLNGGTHKMRYVEANSEKLPFSDGHFDVVTMFNSLDHVESVPAAIAEAQRVLRDGGDLLLIVEVGHKPTLTEPHHLTDNITDLFSGCRVSVRKVFDINDDHNVYASIDEAKPPRSRTAPTIICARFVRECGAA